MNSLPFISHHLFVEAIGNQERTSAKPEPPDRPTGRGSTLAQALAPELLDESKPLSDDPAGPLQVAVAQTLS